MYKDKDWEFRDDLTTPPHHRTGPLPGLPHVNIDLHHVHKHDILHSIRGVMHA